MTVVYSATVDIAGDCPFLSEFGSPLGAGTASLAASTTYDYTISLERLSGSENGYAQQWGIQDYTGSPVVAAVQKNDPAWSIESGWFGTSATQTYTGTFTTPASPAYDAATTKYFRGFVANSSHAGTRWRWTIVVSSPSPAVPVADFIGTPLAGAPTLAVAFTDLTTGVPTSWAWTFGDGGTSTSQNPTHNYTADGVYTVALTATNAGGSDSETKVAYVVVTTPEPGVVIDPTAIAPITITDDIISWRITRGASAEITGGAQPGTLTLVVKNSIAAGADSDNKYNPENGSSPIITYLRDGAAVWVGVNSDGKLTGPDPRGLFGGRFTDITVLPAPGATVAPTVEIMAEDALGWMSRVPVTIAAQVGRSQGAFRALILDAAEETQRDLAHEIVTMPLAAADADALSLLEAINRSNGTRHYIRPENASADWYTYVTRNRQWRLDGTSDFVLSQLSDHVTSTSGWRLSADTVTNQQRATVTPVKFTPGTFSVWTAETLPLLVTTTRPFDVWMDFDDYVRGTVVNSAHSGATPTITLTSFGTRAHLTITVSSGTCTFTHLSIEGALARRLPNESWVSDDLTSQALPRGVRAGSEIAGEYVGTLATARGIAEHVVWRYAEPQIRPTVTIENWFPEMFDVQMFDIVSYTSPQLGVTSRLFEVVGQTHTSDVAADAVQHHALELVLQECFVQADPGWFVLDTSELDSADILAY